MEKRGQGNLVKMGSWVNKNGDVEYQLKTNNEVIDLNILLERQIALHFEGIINCTACGAVTKKSYAQGFCFSCMQTAPEADVCVLRPAMCKAHVGVARDMEWAKDHCLQPHVVYLANTGDVKVGVTRKSQVPYRWVDQGATSAIHVCETPNRHIAGLIELHLGKIFSDKTLWRNMVTNKVNTSLNLLEYKKKAISLLNTGMANFVSCNDEIYELSYPVKTFPEKPVIVSFDSEKIVKGQLNGIKGQYLFFNEDRVLNIRRHTGYLV